MVYLIVTDMDISYMRAKYAPTSSRKKTDNPLLDGQMDREELDVTYPVDPMTGNRQSLVVRALNARTPPALRNQLLSAVDSLPPDKELDKHLTDDDKLEVLKPRYCQTRQEIQSYVDFMNNIVENDMASSVPCETAEEPVTNSEVTEIPKND